MISKNPMQLKAFVKNKARESGISAQLVMQNYLMERLLERVSLSKYKQNFILKGGFLIAAIVGLDSRATMDMDATIKGFTLTHSVLKEIFEEICSLPTLDNISFKLNRITDIREMEEYPALRVHLTANYSPLAVPLVVDVTSGDKITPREVEFSYKLMFDDRSISVMAYNLETILAEKLETILSRGIANTRPRDFYDVYILNTLHSASYNLSTLRQALNETAKSRGSEYILDDYKKIIDTIRDNSQMQGFWDKYRDDYSYAKDILFQNTCESVLSLMDSICHSRS